VRDLKKIYILGTTRETGKMIEALVSNFTISGIITLKNSSTFEGVSGYINLRNFSNKFNIPLYEVSTYSIKDKIDKSLLTKLKIDILIVFGWQRLIPLWLLDHVSIAAIGVHGSADGITKGRGRSPLNWSLILGARKFYFSLFQLTDGIDSGNVISSESFPISSTDDINSLYSKLTTKSAVLITDFLINPIKLLQLAKKQKGEAYYFPKRVAEDGAIDWGARSTSIRNLVRALNKPYPGAFTFFGSQKIYVWKVERALKLNSQHKLIPGNVIFNKDNKQFTVITGDGSINILDYECDSPLEITEGNSFKSYSEKEILSNVIHRHYQTYPNYAISPRLVKYWNSLK